MPESEIRTRKRNVLKGIVFVAIGAALVGGMAALAAGQGRPSLLPLYAENVPAEGTDTSYGLPLAWENAQMFAVWYDEIRLFGDEAETLAQALEPLKAPCCDDNPLAKCCCESGGLICNLVRTARGLGAYLVRAGHRAEEVTEAMEQWMRFVHGDYYVAKSLADRGENPVAYGLLNPEDGSCYRGLCNAPLREGGCGGMGPQVMVERSTRQLLPAVNPRLTAPTSGAVSFEAARAALRMTPKEVDVNIVIPDLGEVGEVKLVRWLVAPGDAVAAGDPVAEVEADKAVFVVEAPCAGVLERTLIAQGQPARPGEAIAHLTRS